MPSAQELRSFQFPGYSFNDQSAAVTFVGMVTVEKTIAALIAAQTGTLSTRTDDDTGEATLLTGHGIETGDIVDIYWSGGRRYGVTVGTVSGTAVPFGAAGGEGSGDALPTATTAITVVEQTAVEVNFDGDDAQIIGIFYQNASDTGAKGHLDLQDAGDASIEAVNLVHETANGGLDNIWNISAGDTNAFTGNRITHGAASHDSTSAGKLYILVGITAP